MGLAGRHSCTVARSSTPGRELGEHLRFFGCFSLRRIRVSKESSHSLPQIDQFFVGPGARADRWQNLVELAEAWADGSGSPASFEVALAEVTPTEEYHAFPGPQLMSALRDNAAANDAAATATFARRITRSLLNRSYRQNAGEWDAQSEETCQIYCRPHSDAKTAIDPISKFSLSPERQLARWTALARGMAPASSTTGPL